MYLSTHRQAVCGLFCLMWAAAVSAQNTGTHSGQQEKQSMIPGQVNGSFQIDAQNYFEDKDIGAIEQPEATRVNAFGNIQYSLGRFRAGIRFEAYLPKPLLGIDEQYGGENGQAGIPIRFATYEHDRFSITLGNFYEQFGTGLTLRSWWAPLLGWDNSIDGMLIKANPVRGIYLKGVYGRQRDYWQLSPGTVRGGDLEVDLGALLNKTWGTQIRVGGSFVSKYETPGPTTQNLILPDNVATYGGRLEVAKGGFTLQAEYAEKINDPSAVNEYIYRRGHALWVTGSYAAPGIGISLSAKRLDNMDYRSERNARGQELLINFIPPQARQHTYRLPTLYLYATQPLNEMGIQGDVIWNIKRGTVLGGKYGTTISVNYARIHDIKREDRPDLLGYDSPFFEVGQELFYQDLNIEVQRKWNKRLKTTLTYLNIIYNKDVILGEPGFGTIDVQAVVLEMIYRLPKPGHSLRGEFQWMPAEEEDNANFDLTSGDWVMLLLEYNVAPHWFVAAWGEYNYDNPATEDNLLYYNATVGYIHGGYRITLGYGKQREGVICVGGICRPVPAMNGFSLSVSSTF